MHLVGASLVPNLGTSETNKGGSILFRNGMQRHPSIFLHTYSTVHDNYTSFHSQMQSMDQSGEAANLARGQLSRETYFFPVPVRA